MVRITLVLGDQLRQDIRAVIVARGLGIDPSLDTEQAELGVRRTFELFVGEDLSASWMIDGVQLDLIEIRHLAQLFGDANFIVAVFGLKRGAGDLHPLVVIHREVTSIAIASAQRSHSQNIGNELELVPVPGPDHRAGAGQSLRFLINVRLIRRLLDFVLDQPVRPSDANDVDGSTVSRIERQRHAAVELAAVQSSQPSSRPTHPEPA